MDDVATRVMRAGFRWLALGIPAAVLFVAQPAHAQYGPGGMPGGGMPGGMPQGPSGEEGKEEGPAEQAPEEEKPVDLEPIGAYAGSKRRRTQIIELDGYLRVRTDYMSNLFLGQGYRSSDGNPSAEGTPPFPWPIDKVSCRNANPSASCDSSAIGGANLRLRLEPTFNVTDTVRVMAQVDAFDNTFMGSTPDSLVFGDRSATDAAAAPSLYTTQDPPEIGQNGYSSSVRAKRAWAEVDSEFGSVRFGRMPWHFGRGIAFNAGACPDCDGGTTVDRIMALTQVYGHQLALSWDFGAQGLTSSQVKFGRMNPQGYPIDLSQKDDVFQLMAAVTKVDDPVTMRQHLDAGEVVFNYAGQLVFRQQEDVVYTAGADTSLGIPQTPGSVTGADELKEVNALLFTPSIWFKLAWRALTIEFEGTGTFGKLDKAGPLGEDATKGLDVIQYGWALASELRLYHDAFFVGFETGGASGDQAENSRDYLNYRWKFTKQPAGDHKLEDFKFSPEYHVDEIFFRRILGTVTNATYFKPQAAYWFDLHDTRRLGITGALIYSIAQVPVSTPGNSMQYGMEMNLGLNYRNTADGFYAGMVWGVFWPFGALDRPGPEGGSAGSLWPRSEEASAAQVLRFFLGVKF